MGKGRSLQTGSHSVMSSSFSFSTRSISCDGFGAPGFSGKCSHSTSDMPLPGRARRSRQVGQARQGDRCETAPRRRRMGRTERWPEPPFLTLFQVEIRCQCRPCLFFPRGASIHAVRAQAPPRELCHDLWSPLFARATETAAGSEAWAATAAWWRFSTVS